MKEKIKKILDILRLKKRVKIIVKIEDCRHYCGFKYGSSRVNNPYQDYIIGLENGEDKKILRNRFIDFLALYKPKYLAKALDIELSKNYPLWVFPWIKYTMESFNSMTNWYDDPFDIPDIITHFSDKGVFRYRIEEEFVWLEKALKSIKQYGYVPEKYKNYATVWKLVAKNGDLAYILLDGNHRVSALHAVGITSFTCILQNIYYEKDIKNWEAVKSNFFTEEDARNILHAYIKGNNRNYYDELKKKDLKIIE